MNHVHTNDNNQQAPITIGTARSRATEWVNDHAAVESGFRGAYFSGSTVGQPDEAILSPSSDVDVVVVIEQEEPPLKLGKFVYHGVLIEVTYLPLNQLSSAEEVLTSHHLAGSFRTDTIITDPTGDLRSLQAEVSQQFAELKWVRGRCKHIQEKIKDSLLNFDASAPLYDQVTSWLFPTGITTHVLLVAALRNPTVRLRYLAVRDVLTEYGQAELYPKLLELLGCAHLTPDRVKHHVFALAHTFDAASAVAKTPFFFSSDITQEARPIAIEGSYKLIEDGNHREAVFWITATFARCHKILAADARPELEMEYMPAFKDLLADLGLTSESDFKDRSADVIGFLPEVWITAEMMMSANPLITGRQ